MPRAATGIALCFLMQTDRVDAPRADDPRSHSQDHELAGVSLSADESGVASRAHKQALDDHDAGYNSTSSSEVGVGPYES